MSGDYMRGKGTFDPSRNPNSYPMTDTRKFPSVVTVSVNGTVIGSQFLPDDPADSRGILSWHSQLRDRKLREAGSYGYRVSMPIPEKVLADAFTKKKFIIRLEANEIPGGIAVYGRNSGRYPLNPSVALLLK
jgi:predicted transcriptional regulator